MATSDKTLAFITGANTGIGFEIVRACAQSDRSYHVFLGSRSTEKGQEAADAIKKEYPESSIVIEVIQIDVSSDDSINSAFDQIEQKTGYVDVLINNAGTSPPKVNQKKGRIQLMCETGHSLEHRVAKGELSVRESWAQMFDVNVTGAHVLTQKFVPLLIKSRDPRLAFLTSGLAQCELMSNTYYPGPPPKAGWPKEIGPAGYRASKTAVNMMMLNWHWALKEDGVKVWSISPGMLATNLGNSKEKLKALGAGDPSIGGNLIKDVIEGKRDADVGKVVDLNGTQSF